METPVQIPEKLFFRIGDVAELLGIKPYVLRYWESEFSILSPQKSPRGQRVYRRSDVELLFVIKYLLYHEKYSMDGARKRLRELRRRGELKGFTQQILYGEDLESDRKKWTQEMYDLTKSLKENFSLFEKKMFS